VQELGLKESERAESVAKIRERAVDFFREQIPNEERFCVEIRNGIRRMVAAMNGVHTSLGDAQTEVYNNIVLPRFLVVL